MLSLQEIQRNSGLQYNVVLVLVVVAFITSMDSSVQETKPKATTAIASIVVDKMILPTHTHP